MKHRSSVVLPYAVTALIGLGLLAEVARGQNPPPAAQAAPAQQGPGESSAEALAIYSDAANFQNRGAFELAAEEWNRFLELFPNDPLAAKARYYAGVCHLQLKEYQAAAHAFQAVVDKHPRADVVEDALLNLAWSQFSLAKQGQPAQYAPAATTFDRLVQRFPKGKHAAQALFYLGEARYAQGERNQALAAYQRLLRDFPQSTLRCETLYALGVTHEELGQHAAAGQVYDNFLRSCAENELATEVRMRKAETLLQADKLAEAERLLAEVAADQDFAAADHALMRQAYAVARQGRFANAAELYARLIERFPASQYLHEAQMSAGRSFYRANDFERAAKFLQQVLARNGADAAEAAHWLSRIHLRNDQPAEALQLIERALANQTSAAGAEAQEMMLQLRMDRADALYELPEGPAKALQQYAEIAERHPQHELAPQALYNAAFAALHLKQYDEAIKHAAAFSQRHAQHRLSVDVQHIAAEAYMQQGAPAQAEQAFRQLIAAHASHTELPAWQLRFMLSLYLQEKYADLLQMASRVTGQLPSASQQAELHFLTGASHFHLNQFQQAAKALSASLAADRSWQQADEALLLLSRTQQELDQHDQARMTALRLIEQFPSSPLLDRAYYRLGQYAYETADYSSALSHYETVLSRWPRSELVPYVLYGKGWSLLKTRQFPKAAEAFTALIDQHPGHDAAADARLARAMSRRQAADLQGAVADLNEYLKGEHSPQQTADALYERGLALAALRQHEAAAQSFAQLLQLHGQYEHADKVLYELAWAHQSAAQPQQALAAFEKLAQQFPDSPLASEAFFHLGEQHYEQGQYAKAVEAYEQAQQRSPSPELSEKADYKLGWSHFQLEQYELALAQFNHQVLTHSGGPLYAEALFMKGESLFRMENFAEALPEYQAALQAQPAQPQIAALASLHGGQSAAQLGQWQESLRLLGQLPQQFPQSPYIAEALYEMGWAHQNLEQVEQALERYEQAATSSRGEVGARARFMMGELYFASKDYEQATRQFQRVMFGFGGQQAPADVKNWQAKAAFEAARIAETQIQAARGAQQRAERVAAAKKYYQEIVNNHPQHELVGQARQRLQALERI